MTSTKKSIYIALFNTLDERIALSKKAISQIQESKKNDNKSSMGDKYETGREVMQAELNKHETQISQAYLLKKQLDLIKLNKTYTQVEFGSLIITKDTNYFISIGLGEVIIKEESYLAISIGSPIGQVMKHKKVGDSIQFREKNIIIKEII